MKRSTLRLTLPFLFLAIFPLLAPATTVRADTPPRAQTLIALAQTRGAIRIIVGLRTSFRPEGELKSKTDVRAQRLTIGQAQDTLLKTLPGTRVNARFFSIPYVALSVNETALRALAANPIVTSIDMDRLNYPNLSISVPLIGAPAAWTSGYTGAGQTVAVLDTGVDKTHPFLAGKVVSEACYSTTDPADGTTSLCPAGASESTEPGSGLNCDTASMPICYHGTHVAGIVAGKDNGSVGFNGVAPDANLIAIQIYAKYKSSVAGYDSDIIRALERVQALSSSMNIAAVNMSLGGDPYAAYCDDVAPAMTAAINNLRSLDIATVISSGNNYLSNKITHPGCISTAVSVGSTQDGIFGSTVDAVSSFSNSATFLSLLAPGYAINSSKPGGGYTYSSGTSMATPHVAGAWAVLKSKIPAASVDDILKALAETGVPVTDTRNGITKPRIRIDLAANALTHAATNLTAALNPSTYGLAATFTATVTGSSATPTGSVAFVDNGTPISGCTAQPLDGSGQATCTTSALAVGSHSITAVYAGNTVYARSSSNSVTQLVNACTTPAAIVLVDPTYSASTPGWGCNHYASWQAGIDNLATGGTLTLNAGTYDESVNLNKSGAMNLNGSITLNGGLTLGAGTLNALDNTLALTGDWTNNGGAFNTGTGTVTFNGSGAQAIGGLVVTTFNNLTIANTGGTVTLYQNATVNSALTLNSDLTTDAYTLTLNSTSCNGTGDVIGSVARKGINTGTRYCFGNPNVSLLFSTGTPPSSMTVTLVKGAPTTFPTAVMRKYILAPTGGSGYAATVRLHYQDSELNGNAETALQLWRYDLSQSRWIAKGLDAQDMMDNWVEKSSVTQFSNWALAAGAPAGITLTAFTAQWQSIGMQVAWETASEIKNRGFNILRSAAQAGPYTKLNPQLIPSRCLGCTGGTSYKWTDSQVTPGQGYYYKLEAVSTTGAVQVYGPVAAGTTCSSRPASPVLLYPSTGSKTNQTRVKLDWQETACATRYMILVRQDTTVGPVVGTNTRLFTSEYLTPTLLRGHIYYWRAAACNASGCSTWSGWRSFRVY